MHRIKFVLSIIFLSSFATVHAQDSQKHEIKLFGQIFHKESTIKNVEINVFIGDSLVLSEETNFMGKFKLKVEEGYRYRIDFNKEKFITKTVMVSAFTSNGSKVSPFAFDVDLIQTRDFRYVDVPKDLGKVAYLYFDEESSSLSWDKQYTQQAQNEIKNYQELNKAKRYEKYSRF